MTAALPCRHWTAASAQHGHRAGVLAALGLAQLAADHPAAGAVRLARLAGGAGRAAGALQRHRLAGGAPFCAMVGASQGGVVQHADPYMRQLQAHAEAVDCIQCASQFLKICC